MHCSGTPNLLRHEPPCQSLRNATQRTNKEVHSRPDKRNILVAIRTSWTPTGPTAMQHMWSCSCCIRRMILLAARWLAWHVIEEGAREEGLKLWSCPRGPDFGQNRPRVLFKYCFFVIDLEITRYLIIYLLLLDSVYMGLPCGPHASILSMSVFTGGNPTFEQMDNKRVEINGGWVANSYVVPEAE